MQLALDKDTHDLILGKQGVELVGDSEFELPVITTVSTTNWYNTLGSSAVYTQSGQLVINGRADTRLARDITEPERYRVEIDVAQLGVVMELNVCGNSFAPSGGKNVYEIVLDEGYSNIVFINTFGQYKVNSMSIFSIGGGGILRVQDGRYTVQLVKSRLLTGLGEWLLDPRIGWLSQTDYERNYDLFDIELRARNIITSTPNVQEVTTMKLEVTNRMLYLTFTAKTTFGVIDLTIPWGN